MIHNVYELKMDMNSLFPFIFSTENLSVFTDASDGSQIVMDTAGGENTYSKIRKVEGDEELYEFWVQDGYKPDVEPYSIGELEAYLKGLGDPNKFGAGNTGWSVVNGIRNVNGHYVSFDGGITQLRNVLTGETLQTEPSPEPAE